MSLCLINKCFSICQIAVTFSSSYRRIFLAFVAKSCSIVSICLHVTTLEPPNAFFLFDAGEVYQTLWTLFGKNRTTTDNFHEKLHPFLPTIGAKIVSFESFRGMSSFSGHSKVINLRILFLRNLIVAQLAKKFCVVYGNRKFITMFTPYPNAVESNPHPQTFFSYDPS